MSSNPVKIINRIIDQQQRLGDFIANGPDDGFAGYVRDGYRTRCNQAANVPGWLLILSPIAKQTLSNMCDPYYEQQGVDGFTSEPPFTGGQCPVRYSIQFDQRRFNNTLQAWEWRPGFTFQFNGPLQIRSEPGVGSCAEGLLGPTDWILFSENETTERSINTGCADIQPSYRFNQLARVDGLPDNCGDPPPETVPGPNPPADPGPLPGPEPFDDPDGGPFPELPIPDFPGPFGDVPVEAPPLEPAPVDPTTIPPTGGDGLPGQPDAVGNPAGEVSGGDDGEEIEFGAPPDGRIWVGCVVTATVDSRLGNIPGTGPVHTVYPAVIGNCSLRYGSVFGTSKRVNSRFTLLGRETTALILDGCFLQAQPGVTLSVSPISAETCPEPTC